MGIFGGLDSGLIGASVYRKGGFFSDVTAGGILKGVTSIFGKTQPPVKVYPRTDQPVVKKANTNMILIIGGAVLVVVVLFVFLKK